MPGARPAELTAGRAVRATAPVRICDVGGWTDTWFGSPGQVCSLAVGPGVTVDAALVERPAGEEQVRLRAPDVGIDGWVAAAAVGAHPLLVEAVADVLERNALPEGLGVDVAVASAVPPGASLGTSAAVVVAVLAAVQELVVDERQRLGPAELARRAHHVETVRAGRQAGVQDGWATAVGGCLRLVVGPYPEVRWRSVLPPADTVLALRRRLVTVALGAHDSSAVHGQVIQDVTACSGPAQDRVRLALRDLGRLAGEAAEAVGAGDLDRWGGVLRSATEAQERLHPDLVGAAHRAAIDLAREQGATAWKVNGAGGAGGSLTVVAPDDPDAVAAVRAALAAPAGWRVLDLRPAGAVEVA